ncbi:MAG TPA: MASE1 domain-containing protein [Vicinamibacterales bacterium]|nr:MASE1 domain-containing protein [Vicinamibacterales bacterium]
MRLPHRPGSLDFVAFAAIYFLFAKLSLLSVMPEGMAIVWLPTAVLLAALILFERRSSALLAVVAIAIETAAGIGHGRVIDAFSVGVINAGEALLAAAILRRRHFDPREMTIRDAASFALAGPIVASAAAAAVFSLLRSVDGGGLEIFRIRWAADALGLTVLTPALLTFALRGPMLQGSPRGWTRWDSAIALALAATLMFTGGGGVATGPEGGPFLAVPLMIALGARATSGAISLVVAGVAVIVLTLVQIGSHPFGDVTNRTAAIKVQQFLFVITLVSQGLAAMLSQIRQKGAVIEQLNTDLEARVKARTAELELALSQVRQLQGLVPICAWCKRVRDDKDYWHSVEQYIEARTDAQFSHGICPSCYEDQLKDVTAFAETRRADPGD